MPLRLPFAHHPFLIFRKWVFCLRFNNVWQLHRYQRLPLWYMCELIDISFNVVKSCFFYQSIPSAASADVGLDSVCPMTLSMHNSSQGTSFFDHTVLVPACIVSSVVFSGSNLCCLFLLFEHNVDMMWFLYC